MATFEPLPMTGTPRTSRPNTAMLALISSFRCLPSALNASSTSILNQGRRAFHPHQFDEVAECLVDEPATDLLELILLNHPAGSAAR
jgi:hypothetical protein